MRRASAPRVSPAFHHSRWFRAKVRACREPKSRNPSAGQFSIRFLDGLEPPPETNGPDGRHVPPSPQRHPAPSRDPPSSSLDREAGTGCAADRRVIIPRHGQRSAGPRREAGVTMRLAGVRCQIFARARLGLIWFILTGSTAADPTLPYRAGALASRPGGRATDQGGPAVRPRPARSAAGARAGRRWSRRGAAPSPRDAAPVRPRGSEPR